MYPLFDHRVDFELARVILSEAIKTFGTNLGVASLDLILRSQQKKKPKVDSSTIDKATKSYLRSLLMNFEKTGGDLHQALDMELVRQRCLAMATNHYQKSILKKGLEGLIKNKGGGKKQQPV